MLWGAFLLLIFRFSVCGAVTKYYDLVERYFEHRCIRRLVIFTCKDHMRDLEVMRHLNSKFMISYISTEIINELYIDSSQYHIGLIANSNCEDFEKLMNKSSSLGIFTTLQHWLVIYDDEEGNVNENSNNEEAIAKLSKQLLTMVTDLKFAYTNNREEPKNWTILDIYNHGPTNVNRLHIHSYGYFNLRQGVVNSNTKNIFERRRNMTGVVIKNIVTFPEGTDNIPANSYIHNIENKHKYAFQRHQALLIYFARDYFNFTYEVVSAKIYGYPMKNGTFDGMVGELGRREGDVGCCVLVRSDRSQVIDYGHRIWHFKTAFHFLKPKAIAPIDRFFKPFSGTVWITSFVFTVLLILALRFLLRVEQYFFNNPRKQLESTVGYLSFYFIATICQQGLNFSPRLYSGRITLFFGLILSVLLYSVYSGSILSHMMRKPPNAINSLRDLINSDMKCAAQNTSYNQDYFQYPKDPDTLDLYRYKIRERGILRLMPVSTGLAEVRKGGFAFQTEMQEAIPIIVNTFTNDEKCQLRRVKHLWNYIHAVFAKRSPYKDALNHILYKASEVGVMARSVDFWTMKTPGCLESDYDLKSVDIEDFFPLLLILVFGVVFSLLMLFLEIIYYRIREKNIQYPYLN